MTNDLNEQVTPDQGERWPTGWLSLIGLLVGAPIGLLIGLVPVGLALGLAVGAGINSLLNEYYNGDPERIRQLLKGKKKE